MNVFTRGIKNALRSPVRTLAIVLMLAISIGLIVAMLVARSSVNSKIADLKSTTATTVTISPAGIRGGFGGGEPLTADQVKSIKSTPHVASTSSSLNDQLGSTDTNLVPSLELGSFGRRQQRFEGDAPDAGTQQQQANPNRVLRTPTPRTFVTGTTDPSSIATNGGALTLVSGSLINGAGADLTAIVGTDLATKNNLTAGTTFTAYGKTFTVTGIYKTSNRFQDSGLIVPLATLQAATAQPGAVTQVTATVDSSDNVSATVDKLKASLGDKADITSQQQQAAQSIASLQSIADLATSGVVGATIAASVIVLLTMTMIVRERRCEIGVIKAIGGTNFKVIAQFVTEALTLTIIGGVIGLAGGAAASGSITQSLVTQQQTASQQSAGDQRGVPGAFRGGERFARQSVQTVTASVTPQTFAIGIGITLLIAFIGSAVPAWLIARVRPADVLRTE